MKTYLIKVDDEMYAKWQAQAKKAGVKLAELIRSRMNGDVKAAHKNAGRVRRTTPRRERTGVAAEPRFEYPVDQHGYILPPDSTTTPVIRDSSGPVHHPMCGCSVCEYQRKLKKK